MSKIEPKHCFSIKNTFLPGRFRSELPARRRRLRQANPPAPVQTPRCIPVGFGRPSRAIFEKSWPYFRDTRIAFLIVFGVNVLSI